MNRRTSKPQTQMVPVTRQGRTHQVPMEMPAPEAPRIPRDWDQIALRAALAVAGVLTIAAIVWSTVSIGALLGGAPGYIAATVFDASWGVSLLMEWLARYRPEKRRKAQKIGWVLLAISMAAIAAHGWNSGSVALAAIGAAVSLIAKLMWHMVMGHVHRDLRPETVAWVSAEEEEAHAMLATATVGRKAEKARAEAAAHRLAMEHLYGGGAAYTVEQEHAAPAVTEVEATDEEVLERAAADQLAARVAATESNFGPEWQFAASRADRTMRAALDTGATLADVLGRIDRSAGAVRPMAARSPETPVSAQVNASGDAPESPEKGEKHRVPQQRPTSLRSAVHTLVALGQTDADAVTNQLSAAMGRTVSRDSVARYIREAQAAASKTPAPEPTEGTGYYA